MACQLRPRGWFANTDDNWHPEGIACVVLVFFFLKEADGQKSAYGAIRRSDWI